MPEHTIDELLRRIDESTMPDPAYEARLRERLRDELHQAVPNDALESRAPTERSEPLTEEVLELEAIATRPRPRIRWWAAAAAAGLTAASVAVVAAVVTNDDESTTIAAAPDTTFVGSTLDTFELPAGDANPYFVAVGDDVWVLTLAGELKRIDGVTGQVVDEFTVPESSPLAVDDDAVWIADAVDGDVLRLDPETGELVERIATGVEVLDSTFRIPMLEGPARQFSNLGGIVTDGSSVWVGDRAGELMRIDPDSNEIDRRIPVPVRPDILRLDGDFLLAANLTGGEVAVIDIDSGDVVHSDVGFDDLAGASLYDGALYTHEGADGTVTRVDLDSGDEDSSEPLGPSVQRAVQPTLPAGLVVSASGVLVGTDSEPASLHVLDPVTLERLDDLVVAPDHGEMTLAPDGSAWATQTSARTLVHITPQPR